MVKSLEYPDVGRYDARLEVAVADQDVEGGERGHLVGVCPGDPLALGVKDVRKRDAGSGHLQAGVGRAAEINGAREEILVQAYSFTLAPIAKSPGRGPQAGREGRGRLGQEPEVGEVHLRHLPRARGRLGPHRRRPYHRPQQGHDHRRRTVITGSFNFTKAAQEKNAENLLIVEGNKALVEKYLANYAAHQGHSEP